MNHNKALQEIKDAYIVLIHYGARHLISENVILQNIEGVLRYGACVTGVRSKDTVKFSNEEGFVADTPDRENVWQIQTPQSFEYNLIKKAYDIYMKKRDFFATDDSMILERSLVERVSIKLIEGEEKNIKITTPEDLIIAENLLKKNV
jgi:2-C-methyl-D-erythritol 4-phosphate cytidylyltransferase